MVDGISTDAAPFQLYCLGVDHHRTPLALRERLSVDESGIPGVLQRLQHNPGIEECVLLSTCNRCEIYAYGRDCHLFLNDLFAEEVGVDPKTLHEHAYLLTANDVIKHLFRVIASLESMVIGEYQIIHQVKTAYHLAQQHGCTSTILDGLFQRSLTVAKDVRSRTSIGAHKVSIASVGVELAQHVHGNLSKSSLLVVGAGEIAELATVHLFAAGVERVTVINRTHERALDLAGQARFAAADLQTMRWSDLQDALASHDIVVTSTAARMPVITTTEIRNARRRCLRPLVIIDLAVPRDVEVAVGDLADVYRYDLDHLDRIVADNREIRSEELDQVELVINEHLTAYHQHRELSQSNLPAELSSWFEHLVESEMQRLRGKLHLSDQEQEVVRHGLHRVAAKMRHHSLRWLRQQPGDHQRQQVLRDLFGL